MAAEHFATIPCKLHTAHKVQGKSYFYNICPSTCATDNVYARSYGVNVPVAIFFSPYESLVIDYFTIVGSVTWPLNGNEAAGDLALIRTSLVLFGRSSCSYAN